MYSGFRRSNRSDISLLPNMFGKLKSGNSGSQPLTAEVICEES